MEDVVNRSDQSEFLQTEDVAQNNSNLGKTAHRIWLALGKILLNHFLSNLTTFGLHQTLETFISKAWCLVAGGGSGGGIALC